MVRSATACLIVLALLSGLGFAAPGSLVASVTDTTPPVLSIDSPAGGSTISTTLGSIGGQVPVAVTARDADSGPVAVVVRLNGEIAATDGDVDGKATIYVAVSNHHWLPGVNILAVTATDASGNDVTAEVLVLYDAIPPTVALAEVATPTSAGVLALRGTVTDWDAGTKVSVTRTGLPDKLTTSVASDGSFSVIVPLSEGRNVLSAVATDSSGNSSQSAQVAVVRDSVAPVVALSGPTVTAASTVEVTGSVNERVSRITYSLDGAPSADVAAAADGTFAVPLALAGPGTHTLSLVAVDMAGNSTTRFLPIRRDLSVPGTAVTRKIPGFTNRDAATVEGFAQLGSSVTIKCDGVVTGVIPVPAGGTGTFSAIVPLEGPDGDRTIDVTVLNPETGLSAESRYVVTLDTTAPMLTLYDSVVEATVDSSAALAGSASEMITGLELNGEDVAVGEDGRSFSAVVVLAAGPNTFTFDAVDRAGNTGTTQVFITRDALLPNAGEPGRSVAAELTILAGAGGTVGSADGGVELNVPAGAFSEDVTARITRMPVTENPLTGFRTFTVLRVEFLAGAGAAPVTIQVPYTLKLTYDTSKVTAADASLLEVCHWSDVSTAWVEVSAAQDSHAGVRTVTTSRSGTFALVIDELPGARPSFSSIPSNGLHGGRWLASGAAPAGSTVSIVANDSVQSTTSASSAGRWQAWVTLNPGRNSIYASVGGAFPRSSAEAHLDCAPLVLTDIAGHWAEQDIKDLVDRNVITGYEDDTFRTENDVTRAEFCTLIGKALGLEQDAAGAAKFADCTSIPEWARPFIGGAAEAGIVTGFEDGTFRADSKITRAEMATMMSRSLSLRGGAAAGTDPTFADSAAIPGWAAAHIAKAAACGIIKGYSDSTFGPDRLATRGEAATMVMRLLNLK